MTKAEGREHCLGCGAILDPLDFYCSHCGLQQGKDTSYLLTGEEIQDTIEDLDLGFEEPDPTSEFTRLGTELQMSYRDWNAQQLEEMIVQVAEPPIDPIDILKIMQVIIGFIVFVMVFTTLVPLVSEMSSMMKAIRFRW